MIWNLGQKAAKASRLPSECLPGLADEIGDYGCWCVDNAVMGFVGVVENALTETYKVSINKAVEHHPKYELSQLLDDDFRIPRPPSRKNSAGALKAMFGGNRKKRKKGAMITSQGFRLPPTIAGQYEDMLAKKAKSS